MIELLTVIAIIALLAAIIFPVFAQVRNSAARASCMSNMSKIYQAVKLYHLDNRSYPEFLFGPAQEPNYGQPNAGPAIGTSMQDATSSTPGPGNTPSNLSRLAATNGLYPEYIRSVGDFRCPHNVVSRASSDGLKRTVTWYEYQRGAPIRAKQLDFWAYDSYDTNPMINTTVSPRTLVNGQSVLRYSKVWENTVPAGDPNLIRPSYARQLLFRNPSDDTYITMCTYHVNQEKVIVLFLGGTAKVYDVKQIDPVRNTGAAPPDYVMHRFTPQGATP